jgi:flavin-binding protein dodecin
VPFLRGDLHTRGPTDDDAANGAIDGQQALLQHVELGQVVRADAVVNASEAVRRYRVSL